LRSGYAPAPNRSRDLALAEVEDRGVDLFEALRGKGAAVRARDVTQHPLLAVGIDEVEAARFLVALQLGDEPQARVDRLDQGSIVVRDLLAELTNGWV
jgi:hypothetical protein